MRKAALAETGRSKYEHRAKSCLTCETQGECCTDAHFVNVHITRLEAVSMVRTIAALPERRRIVIRSRVNATVADYGLTGDGDSFEKTYACPLFEKGTGCLVHNEGKPVPCITHACYEDRSHLPPEQIEAKATEYVEAMNRRVYGGHADWRPLPVWLAEGPEK